MSMQDPIADAITRVRNAQRAFHSFTEISNSKINIKLLEILQQEGYIDAYKITDDFRKVKVALKYYRNTPVIQNIKRISKPGKRVYVKSKDVKLVQNGLGIAIISTSMGMLTDKKAKELNVGGELLITVE